MTSTPNSLAADRQVGQLPEVFLSLRKARRGSGVYDLRQHASADRPLQAQTQLTRLGKERPPAAATIVERSSQATSPRSVCSTPASGSACNSPPRSQVGQQGGWADGGRCSISACIICAVMKSPASIDACSNSANVSGRAPAPDSRSRLPGPGRPIPTSDLVVPATNSFSTSLSAASSPQKQYPPQFSPKPRNNSMPITSRKVRSDHRPSLDSP